MVLEQATFNVPAGNTAAFIVALNRACALFPSVQGYVRHEIRHGIENPETCLLLVWWETLEAHTVGFRQSPVFPEWRALVKPHYTGSPTVLHYS
jgi:heme-degrading monooxygenase HmoA